MSDLKNIKEQIKKLVLTLVLGVFAFGASGFQANNLNASGCVKQARAATLQAAELHGEHPNDAWDLWSQYYMGLYKDCLSDNGII